MLEKISYHFAQTQTHYSKCTDLFLDFLLFLFDLYHKKRIHCICIRENKIAEY